MGGHCLRKHIRRKTCFKSNIRTTWSAVRRPNTAAERTTTFQLKCTNQLTWIGHDVGYPHTSCLFSFFICIYLCDFLWSQTRTIKIWHLFRLFCTRLSDRRHITLLSTVFTIPGSRCTMLLHIYIKLNFVSHLCFVWATICEIVLLGNWNVTILGRKEKEQICGFENKFRLLDQTTIEPNLLLI